MKADIHPEYMECTVHCACGEEFTTRSTKPEMRVDVCSKCHPFYTGQQKMVDSEGRVDKFIKRYGLQERYKDYDQEEQKAKVEEARAALKAERDQRSQEMQEEAEAEAEAAAEATETAEEADVAEVAEDAGEPEEDAE
ncbi:MAG: 50S ribosomal protein L31 [Armatimonadota bacterium]